MCLPLIKTEHFIVFVGITSGKPSRDYNSPTVLNAIESANEAVLVYFVLIYVLLFLFLIC
jgi:hypothetical protein